MFVSTLLWVNTRPEEWLEGGADAPQMLVELVVKPFSSNNLVLLCAPSDFLTFRRPISHQKSYIIAYNTIDFILANLHTP